MLRPFDQASVVLCFFPFAKSRSNQPVYIPTTNYHIPKDHHAPFIQEYSLKNAPITAQYLEGYPACQGSSEYHRTH